MKTVVLGKTGIEVTELCFGALPCGPLQKKLPLGEGAEVIAYALSKGVNFVDTAQIYGTYGMVEKAMRISGKRPVISTKSPASSYEDMQNAIKEAMEKMDLEQIDIMLLHAARSDETVFESRKGAWECLKDYRAKGLIKAIGLSSHSVRAVSRAVDIGDVDVIFPIINKIGRGVIHGTKEEMEQAIERATEKGKGVYLMKIFGGGSILNQYSEAIDYCRKLSEGRSAMVIGMVAKEEVDMNIAYLEGENVDAQIAKLREQPEKIFFVVGGLCMKCGCCIKACHSSAISMCENCAVIDKDKCIRCGYCVNDCPEFAIRMV